MKVKNSSILDEKLRDFGEKNSEISQKTESTGGFDPKILQNFGEKKKPVITLTFGPFKRQQPTGKNAFFQNVGQIQI